MATSSFHRDLQAYNRNSHLRTLPVNIDWPERLASIAAGVRLFSGGIKGIIKHPIRNAVLAGAGGYLLYRGLTGNCPLYSRLTRNSTLNNSNVNIRTTLTINRPRQEVYDFWRRLENLPLFMAHLASVHKISETRSHWEAKLPGNIIQVGWDAEIVNDEPGYVIGWKSIEGAAIDNAGKVEFSDLSDGRGTLLKVVISYQPPVGTMGNKIAHLLNPVFERLVRDDIRNFKEYMEGRSRSATGVYSDMEDAGQSEII